MPFEFGEIESQDDFATYSFTLRAGQAYAISVSGYGSGALPDPLVAVFRDGTKVVQDDDSGPGSDPFLLYKPQADTEVVVRVDGYGAFTGGFRLAVQKDDFRNYVEAPGGAGQLDIGGSRTGKLDYGLDRDLFTVKLEQGESYVFTLKGRATDDGSLRDPILTLFGPNGATLVSDDDGGTGNNSRIAYTATADGRYYLEADGFGVSRGTYEITAADAAVTMAAHHAHAAGVDIALDSALDFLI